MTTALGVSLPAKTQRPVQAGSVAQRIIPFPPAQPRPVKAELRQPSRAIPIGMAIVATHIAVFALIIALTHHNPTPAYAPDRVIDLMDVPDMTPPPPTVPNQPKQPIAVPDTQRMQVKDEAKPPQPVASADPAPASAADSGAITYLPQSNIDVSPILDKEAFKARVVYPPMAKNMGLEAMVILELFIDQTGTIRKIVVLKDPGNGFAEAAVAAMQGISLKPAMAGGSPVAVRFRTPVYFTLK